MTKPVISHRVSICIIAVFFVALVPLSLASVHAVSDDQSNQTEAQNDNPARIKNEVERNASDLQASVQSQVDQKAQKKNGKVLQAAQRKKVCENRQNAINNKLAAYTQAATKQLGKINEAFDTVKTYQKEHLLPVANYSELQAAADEQRAPAEKAVSTLEIVAKNVDCSDPDTVVKLSTVRDAALVARQALHDYRTAVKDVVTVLVHSSETEEAETTNTTNTADRNV